MKIKKYISKEEWKELVNKERLRKLKEIRIFKLREEIFEKLNWEERNYFAELCSDRDDMDKFLRTKLEKIEDRINNLEAKKWIKKN